ncbi:MAG: hypothetical protein IPM57_01845 [Oligoflexia bacterium]|nr:hypothetical protein [Oligoflexia bacterium]
MRALQIPKLFLLIATLVMAAMPLAKSEARGFDEIIRSGLTLSEQQELQRLSYEQGSLQGQVHNLTQELNTLNYSVSNLSQEVERLRYSYQEANRDYREAAVQIRRSQEEIARLRRQLQEARLRREQQINQLQAQINQIRSQLSSQSSNIANLERELQNIYNTRNPAGIPPLQSEISSLQSQKAPHQANYNRALEDLKRWAHVSEEDCRQSIICYSQRMQAQEARDRAKAQLDKIDQQISAKQNEINRLNGIERAYAAKEQEVNRAKQYLAQLNQNIAKNEAEVKKLQSEPLREERLIEQEERELRQAERRLPELQRLADNMRYRLEAKDRELQDLASRRDSYIRQINEANYQLSYMQKRIDELNQKKSSQLVVVGSKLNFNAQQELTRLGALMLSAESDGAASVIYNSQSVEAVVLLDSIVLTQLGNDVLYTLTQFARNGKTVTLVGDVTALSSLIEARELLNKCAAPFSTSVGLVRSCR